MVNVICGNCDEPIPGETGNEDPATRQPCPKCGAISRKISIHVSSSLSIATSANAIVVTYSEVLLDVAKGLIDEGTRHFYSIAVVVTHIACEVAVERGLLRGFSTRNISDLEDSILEFVNGCNLGNDRNRDLYNALTKREIHKQQFWQQFKASATRRNKIMHSGYIANEQEARDSLAAGRDFIAFVQQP